ncbi:MAG: FHA domain-containing protein [Bdellovibrionales bacterium]|nr:FHA domain-containing protein [Bdellovibrionales bacterium]
MKQPLFIRIYSDDRLQGIKQFAVEQIVIGTSENAQLLLESDTVSPVHAVIEERDTGYYISDLGSTLGTLVNSESIIDKKLESGDFIQVGEFNLEFFIGIPKPSSPPKVGLDDVVPPVGLVGGESTATAEELPTLVSEDHIEAGESADKPLEEPASPTLATSHESLGGSEKETQEKQERVTPPIPQAPIDSQEQKSEQEPKLSSDHIPQQSVIHLKKPSEVGKAPIKLHRDGPKVPKPPQAASYSKKKKIGGTFAPPGAIKNLDEVIRPGKGTVVEVLVAWNQRVIATHHFHEPKTYTIGPNANADITIPIRTASGSSSAFLKLGSETSILLGSNPSGMWVGENGQMSFADLRKQNRLVDTKKGTEVKLQQGEMIRWDLENGLLSIYVRFKPDTVKPIVAPFLDFTTTEFTGIVLAGVITAILGLYMLVYSPVDMEEEALLEVPIRRAVVRFNRPKEKKVVKIDSSPKE